MQMPIRRYLIFALLAGHAASLRGQDPSCLHRTVPLVVQDKNGTPEVGLTASDLSGEFRGKPVQILSVTVDDHPRQILILLDASGSMIELGNGKWPLTLRIIADLLASVRQQDSISLMIFSGKVDEVIDAAQGREAILKRLRELVPGRKAFPKGSRYTAIWDAILTATSSPKPLHSGDVIYLVSDGEDNASRKNHSRVRHTLLEQGIRIFALLLSSSPYYGAGDHEAVRGLVSNTGGVSVVVSPKQSSFAAPEFKLREEELLGVERTLATQLNLISRNYQVEIGLPLPADKFRPWKLSPSPSAGGWRRDASLSYPSELVPCQPKPDRVEVLAAGLHVCLVEGRKANSTPD